MSTESKIIWGRKFGFRRERPRGKLVRASHTSLTKRRKFVISAALLSIGLFFAQRLPPESRYLAIAGVGVLAYLLSAWSLAKELKGIAWITNLILPTIYPVAVGLFYFLLPQAAWTRGLVLLIFAVTMYGLLLTANIFAVASIRTIQLLRAGRTVGFLLSVLTAAFLYHVIFALRLPYLMVVVLVGVSSVLLLLSGIWSYTLTNHLEKEELATSLVGGLVMMQAALPLTFWLIDAPLSGITLSMMMYVQLGILQHEAEKRLFTRTVQEYLGFAIIVLIVVVATVLSRWMS